MQSTYIHDKQLVVKILKILGSSVFLLLVLFTFFVAPGLGSFLKLEESPQRSDAIIILMGGVRPERAVKASALFHEHFSHRIVFGSGFYRLTLETGLIPTYQWSPSGDRYYRHLLKLGVSRSKIIQLPILQAFDTESEMRELISAARNKNWKKIILVTSSSHSRRAKKIWERLAPDIQTFMVPADDVLLSQWWRSRQGLWTVTHEILGFIKEYLRSAGIMS